MKVNFTVTLEDEEDTVKSVNTYRRDWAVNATEIANRQMQVMFPPYRVGNRDEWMRIALAPYLR